MITEEFVPTLKGAPLDKEPASLEAAKLEQDELLNDLRSIDEQLGAGNVERDGVRLSSVEYMRWRKGAITARKLTERRYRFVKEWARTQRILAQKERSQNRKGGSGKAIGATTQARDLAKRVSFLESISIAAIEYVRDQSAENLGELVRVSENAYQSGMLFEEES